MLWYKSWLDTQWWFIMGSLVLSAQVIALYMSYPMDPLTTYPNGALGVSPIEMTLIRTGGFREYVWVRWFSTTMLIFWPFFVAAIAGSGFERSAGREYLLSLPLTRRRIVGTRLAIAAAEIAALTVLPSLLLCAMAPLVGQRYPVADALVHSLILCIGGLCLFGLTMFLRTVTSDAGAYTAVAAIVFLWGLITFVAKDLTPYSVFRVLNGADYFFAHHIPWTGLTLSVVVGGTLISASLRMIERRDY